MYIFTATGNGHDAAGCTELNISVQNLIWTSYILGERIFRNKANRVLVNIWWPQRLEHPCDILWTFKTPLLKCIIWNMAGKGWLKFSVRLIMFVFCNLWLNAVFSILFFFDCWCILYSPLTNQPPPPQPLFTFIQHDSYWPELYPWQVHHKLPVQQILAFWSPLRIHTYQYRWYFCRLSKLQRVYLFLINMNNIQNYRIKNISTIYHSNW